MYVTEDKKKQCTKGKKNTKQERANQNLDKEDKKRHWTQQECIATCTTLIGAHCHHTNSLVLPTESLWCQCHNFHSRSKLQAASEKK